MSDGFKFELGTWVKDRITPFVGVVVVRAERLYGARMYAIRANALKDGAPVDADRLDEYAIVEAEGEPIPAMTSPFKWELGSRGKDRVTGYEGVIYERQQHINGCNLYSLHSGKEHEGKPVSGVLIEEDAIEITVAATEPAKIRKTGAMSGRTEASPRGAAGR